MLKNIKAIFAAFLIGLLAVGFGVSTMQVAGDEVMVACNRANREYYAPPYVSEEEYRTGRFVFMRLGEAQELGYSINYEHRDNGFFTGPDTPLLLHLLGWKKDAAWEKDGSWGVREWQDR